MTTEPRSEVELVADLIAHLKSKRLIRLHGVSGGTAAVEAAAGLMPGEIRQAEVRVSRRGYIAPRRREMSDALPEPESERALIDAYAKSRKPREARNLRVDPVSEAWERKCKLCGVWKPLDSDHFTKRIDTHDRRTWRTECRGCWAEKSRIRYLSVEKRDALSTIGVEFVLAEGDDVVGLRCLGCGNLLRSGDKVRGEAEVRHADCDDYVEPEGGL